jgi:hypothetical protein
MYICGSSGGLVGIMTGLGGGQSGVRIQTRARVFYFSRKSRLVLGRNHPPIQQVERLFTEGKTAGA